jgi:hypothetical protein
MNHLWIKPRTLFENLTGTCQNVQFTLTMSICLVRMLGVYLILSKFLRCLFHCELTKTNNIGHCVLRKMHSKYTVFFNLAVLFFSSEWLQWYPIDTLAPFTMHIYYFNLITVAAVETVLPNNYVFKFVFERPLVVEIKLLFKSVVVIVSSSVVSTWPVHDAS